MSKNAEERDRVLRSENEEGKDEVEAHRYREAHKESTTEPADDDKSDEVEAHRFKE